MTKQQLRAIVKADNARRAAREAEENQTLGITPVYSPCPAGVDPYLWDRSITGVPSHANRTYRASVNCWDRGMRGKAYDYSDKLTATEPTVAVTSNGITTVVPVSNFRPTRATRAAVRVDRSEVKRYIPHNEAVALPSIRTGEEY